MADRKLVGQNYTTPDLRAKVTGRSKYAEDFRAEGMLFAKLLLSPFPHARIRSIDTSAALAMPGVRAILTADDVPGPKDQVSDAGVVIKANPRSEKALTNEPLYQGEPVLAVAAVDELTAADAIEKIKIRWERLPFSVDPVASLLPGAMNPRVEGNVWVRPTPVPGQPPPLPEVIDLKWTDAEVQEYKAGRLPMGKDTDPSWSFGDIEAGRVDTRRSGSAEAKHQDSNCSPGPRGAQPSRPTARGNQRQPDANHENEQDASDVRGCDIQANRVGERSPRGANHRHGERR